MFTGDATSVREHELIDRLSNSNLSITVDFLAVSHHGSAYSTTEEFLHTINPQYAFISAGGFSHPSYEVIERLQEANVERTFVTKEVGMIAVGVNRNSTFLIRYESNYVDIPLIVVVLSCFGFIIAKIDFNCKKSSYFQKRSAKVIKYPLNNKNEL